MISNSIIFGISAFILSYFGVTAFRLWAGRRDLIAHPNERSSHEVPTPTGGGLVIVVVATAGSLIFGILTSQTSNFLPLAIGCGLVAIVSWIDDLTPLQPVLRFGIHSAAAAIAIYGLGYFQVTQLPLFHEISLGWAGLPITFLWIIGLTNAFNFMDGIDGIAGTQAVVAGLGWLLVGWSSDQPLVMMTGLLLAASSFGFLLQNWQPAKIFMGDVGSAFLGYSFAVLPLLLLKVDPAQTKSMSCAVLFLWVFIFDSIFTFLRRAIRRENVFAAHRSHLYQRLVISGFSHQRVTLVYGLLALTGSFLSIAWFDTWSNYRVYLWLLPVMCVGLWLFVAKRERAKNVNVVQFGN